MSKPQTRADKEIQVGRLQTKIASLVKQLEEVWWEYDELSGELREATDHHYLDFTDSKEQNKIIMEACEAFPLRPTSQVIK